MKQAKIIVKTDKHDLQRGEVVAIAGAKGKGKRIFACDWSGNLGKSEAISLVERETREAGYEIVDDPEDDCW